MKPKSNLKFVDPRYSYSLSLPHAWIPVICRMLFYKVNPRWLGFFDLCTFLELQHPFTT